MKTSFSLLKPIIFLLILCNSIYAQLIAENFNYSAGILNNVTTNWKKFQPGNIDIQVIDGNLEYSNYAFSNNGRMILLNGGLGSRSGVVRNFTTQKNNGVSVYYSFLLNVVNTSDLDINTSAGDDFINFVSSLGTNRSYIFIRQGSDPSKFSLGLAKASSDDIFWYNTELSINTTYLIIVRYYFQSGSDMTRLWINPDLLGAEPTPNITTTTGTDASDICGLQIKQRAKSGHEQIDGLRVTTSWAQIPLPVELIAFTASVAGNQVSLNWTTATEINNYGFEVQRSQILQAGQVYPPQAGVESETPQAGQAWEKIGFIQGNGNSNSPKEYSFTDNPVGGTSFGYRLKQIDIDGKFEYSKSLEVMFNPPSKSAALQNYPNPFNPSTTINYKIQTTCFTTLKVYDMLGKEIAILVNEEKPAGIYDVVWNGKDNSGIKLTSGIYFYRLTAGTFVQTRKMILLN